LNHRFLLGKDGTWLEQAGEVELLGGWAEVALVEEFAERMAGSEYEVFLSSYDAAVVFVQNRTPSGFEVHAMRAPGQRRHSHVLCAYRVVGRAKR
jgi:hypothetical protein